MLRQEPTCQGQAPLGTCLPLLYRPGQASPCPLSLLHPPSIGWHPASCTATEYLDWGNHALGSTSLCWVCLTLIRPVRLGSQNTQAMAKDFPSTPSPIDLSPASPSSTLPAPIPQNSTQRRVRERPRASYLLPHKPQKSQVSLAGQFLLCKTI